MRGNRGFKLGSMLAAVCAVGLYAGSASATLALNQGAALSVVPFAIANPFNAVWWSYATVTNASSQNVTLHLEFIDGDTWNGQDYSCPVTAEETVLFVFRPVNATTIAVDFKCSFAVLTPNGVIVQSVPTTLLLPYTSGLLTVAVESPVGNTISANILFADWLVVDFTNATAVSAPSIGFQGLAALGQNGDRNYSFNGIEYSTFPAQVASNFIAPDPIGNILSLLILFTLDGTVNGQPAAPGGQVNPVALRGNVYNERESSQSFNFNFDCFTIVQLQDLSPAFLNTGPNGFMGSAGHFDLTPVATGAGDPAHEFNFGTGNATRKRPVMGWMVGIISGNSQLPAFATAPQLPSPNFPGGASVGTFSWTIGTSVTSFTPLAGDTPTYSSN